jgi:hypothetical protein
MSIEDFNYEKIKSNLLDKKNFGKNTSIGYLMVFINNYVKNK